MVMRSDFKDLTGKTFGRYTVMGMTGKMLDRDHCWEVLCECGNTREIGGRSLKSGSAKSCGCLSIENSSKPHKMLNGTELKHCYKCDEWKQLSYFYNNKNSLDKLTYECKACSLKQSNSYRKENPEIGKLWVQNNPDKVKTAQDRFSQTDKRKQYWKQPSISLRQRISGSMRKSLVCGKKGHHWESLVGYTLHDLETRLKQTMPDGYSWDDISGLHIDHIIPLSVFNITDEHSLDFKRCWALSNLRFLPALENIKKSDKLFAPFQPSLAIGVH